VNFFPFFAVFDNLTIEEGPWLAWLDWLALYVYVCNQPTLGLGMNGGIYKVFF